MERDLDHWQARLPEALHEHVVWPVKWEAHHDDGVPASKWRGYDALGLLCWYRHRYTQWNAALDGEELPVVQLLREEEFEAWRSLAGPWVRRVQRVTGSTAATVVQGVEAVAPDPGRYSDSGFELVPAQAIPRL